MADVRSYNIVLLLGHCAVPPEEVQSAGGKNPFVKLGIATNEIYRQGQKHNELHKVVVFGKKRCEFVMEHVITGSLIMIKGKLRHKTIGNRTYTEVSAEDFVLLPKTQIIKEEEVEEKKEPF